MAKGDDAVARKKNKINRKKIRSGESNVTARVAAIIASKRRRKTGKRRVCEAMCFSLPTPDDPFNDRRDEAAKKPKKDPVARKTNNSKLKGRPPDPEKKKVLQLDRTAKCEIDSRNKSAIANVEQAAGIPKRSLSPDEGCLSKFLVICLNTIQAAWKEEEEGAIYESVNGPLVASKWGVELGRCCSAGSNVVDTSGACATREQVVWVTSMASATIARKEKHGIAVTSPFLLYLVPSREKAVQVRSVCKPLKALGVHTISLHPGASLDHQLSGLKTCEPEFLVSTPDRLIELVSLGAVDISGTSLLVLDGLKNLVDFGFADNVKYIRERIRGDPQIVVFSDCYGGVYTPTVQNLLRGRVYRLSLYDSIASRSVFISQHVHFYSAEEEKIAKAMQILTEAVSNTTPSRRLKVLFIAPTTSKAELFASSLKSEGFALSNDSLNDASHGTDGEKAATILVKDIESAQQRSDVDEFEIVIFVEFPSSVEDYVGVLTKMARHSLAGMLHSFFCEVDAPLAQPLMKVLEQCGQAVPETLRNFDKS